MMAISPDDWVPVGVEALEPAAMHAIRAQGSVSVTAGPGAGKTEFLAQKVAYLFQTGICGPPYRILAISFKRDAAANLSARVGKRLPKEVADRFVSMTFDSFTKGLVDRFKASLPGVYGVDEYELMFPTSTELRRYLEGVAQSTGGAWGSSISRMRADVFEQRLLGATRLPADGFQVVDAETHLLDAWWSEFLIASDTSRLSFVMLNRLAELILRHNPQVVRALRATYPIVFVDEFQDTTHAQYDFLTSAFVAASNTITTVGDDKQRIMKWAGAKTDSFHQFSKDYTATRYPLQFNFRSSPGLVQLQHIVARSVDAGTPLAISQVQGKVHSDVAELWSFDSLQAEATTLAAWIVQDARNRSLSPSDYAVLVRQKADAFEEHLSDPFAAVGLTLINENRRVAELTLQDLHKDVLAQFLSATIRLASVSRDADAWELCRSTYAVVADVDSENDADAHAAEREVADLISKFRNWFGAYPVPVGELADQIVDETIDFLRRDRLVQAFLDYGVGDSLKLAIAATREHLEQCLDRAHTWPEVSIRFNGEESVPLMTIHRSKGLEFDTVVFLALDDRMWWSHSRDPEESTATFFVGLSRAKQKVVVTYCSERGGRAEIAALYNLLTTAGVPEISH